MNCNVPYKVCSAQFITHSRYSVSGRFSLHFLIPSIFLFLLRCTTLGNTVKAFSKGEGSSRLLITHAHLCFVRCIHLWVCEFAEETTLEHKCMHHAPMCVCTHKAGLRAFPDYRLDVF